MTDSKLVDHGFGEVPPLPVPARQRPDVVDPTPTYRLAGGPEVLAQTVEQQRQEASSSGWEVTQLRARAAELEGDRGGTGPISSHGAPSTGKHPVNIKMLSGQILRGIGGECLVSALANGGQPVE